MKPLPEGSKEPLLRMMSRAEERCDEKLIAADKLGIGDELMEYDGSPVPITVREFWRQHKEDIVALNARFCRENGIKRLIVVE